MEEALKESHEQEQADQSKGHVFESIQSNRTEPLAARDSTSADEIAVLDAEENHRSEPEESNDVRSKAHATPAAVEQPDVGRESSGSGEYMAHEQTSSSLRPHEMDETSSGDIEDPLIALIQMGFDVGTASSALFATNYDYNTAIDMLLSLET